MPTKSVNLGEFGEEEVKEEVREERVKNMPTLQDLFASNKRIWVVNRTKEVLGTPMYLILDLGGRRSEPIPPGPEPYCLSDKISKKRLEECDDLFRLIDRNVLQLVSEEEAQAFYKSNPDAKKRIEAKLKSFSYTTEGGSVRGFKDLLGKNVFKQFQNVAVSSEKEIVSGVKKKVSPRLQWIIQGYEDGVLDAAKFKDELSAILSELTEVDLLYIRQHDKAQKIFEQLK